MAEIDVKAIRAVAEKAGTSEDIDLKYSAICIRHDIPALCDAYEAQAKEIERLKGLLTDARRFVSELGLSAIYYDDKSPEYRAHCEVRVQLLRDARALHTKIAKDLES